MMLYVVIMFVLSAQVALASVVLQGVHPEASLALHQARQAGASLEEAAQVALLALAAGVLEAHLREQKETKQNKYKI
jgi:hypothetical protein